MNQRLSKYVLKIPMQNSVIYFNTTNYCIFELEHNDSLSDSYIVDFMKENDFFVDDNDVLANYYKINSQCDELNLIINVTESCNLNCSYCSQRNKRLSSIISIETLDSIIDYLDDVISRNKYKKLKLKFFGGEPLIGLEKIKYFIDHFSTKIDIEYIIDTNATLLKPEFIELFENIIINITLSDREDHDKNRRYLDGNGSYDDIVKNLINCRYLLNSRRKIILRFNANKNNITTFENFVQEVYYLDITKRIDLVRTRKFLDTEFSDYLTQDEFNNWSCEATTILYKYGFEVDFPSITYGPCKAYRKDSFKIFSDGSVGICDALSYHENMPNIKDFKTIDFNKYYYQYKSKLPIDTECTNCVYFLLCGGKYFCKYPNYCNFFEFSVMDYLKCIFHLIL